MPLSVKVPPTVRVSLSSAEPLDIWFVPVVPDVAFVPIKILTHLPAVTVAEAPPEVMVIVWLEPIALNCEEEGEESTNVFSVYVALVQVPVLPVAKSISLETILPIPVKSDDQVKVMVWPEASPVGVTK